MNRGGPLTRVWPMPWHAPRAYRAGHAPITARGDGLAAGLLAERWGGGQAGRPDTFGPAPPETANPGRAWLPPPVHPARLDRVVQATAGLLARGSAPRSAFPGSMPSGSQSDRGSPPTVAGAAPDWGQGPCRLPFQVPKDTVVGLGIMGARGPASGARPATLSNRCDEVFQAAALSGCSRHGVLVLAMALRVTRSLRMVATRASRLGLPLPTRAR